MEMETPWADYPLLLYRPPDIISDAWGKIKSPGAITLRGLFPLSFLPILRIVYFYMGEEG